MVNYDFEIIQKSLFKQPSRLQKFLQVVDLSQCHGNENKSFSEGPKDHSAACAIVDRSVHPLLNFHGLLFLLDSCRHPCQLIDQFFQLVLVSFYFHVLSSGDLPNINGEHQYIWSHGSILLLKQNLLCSIYVSSKCVFPTSISVSFIHSFIIRPCHLHIDVGKKLPSAILKMKPILVPEVTCSKKYSSLCLWILMK